MNPKLMKLLASATVCATVAVAGAAATLGADAPAKTPVSLDNEATQVTVTRGAGLFAGTVLFGLGDAANPKFDARLVEVDSAGKVVWEHRLGESRQVSDVNRLSNNNVMFVAGGKGITEIDRAGKLVWNWNGGASHHADVLPNGNVLTVSAGSNWVREIDFDGQTVWEWNAKEQLKQYGVDTYDNYASSANVQNPYAVFRELRNDKEDWTHVNSAQRLPNGNTLMSLRNLDLVVEVNPQKEVVWTFGALVLKHQHSPQVIPNGNLLVVDNGNSRVIEVDRQTQQIVWQYKGGLNIPIKAHAQRLDSGDTLITDSLGKRLIIVNKAGDIVWELVIQNKIADVYRAKYWAN